MQNSLILLRGLPGSGKSTLAHVLEDDQSVVLSIDDYFTDKNGNYSFVFSENHKAYEACISRTADAIKNGVKKIIIHNTFTMDWEMEPYFKLASIGSYRIFVVTVENRFNLKNTHGVSDEQLKKMAEKYRVVLF